MNDIFEGLDLGEGDVFHSGEKEDAIKEKDRAVEQSKANSDFLDALETEGGMFDNLPDDNETEGKGLREIVMTTLKRRGGVNYLQRLPDKDFVKLLTSVIPAELKVKHELVPHEDFLKMLADHPKVTDVDPSDIKILTKS
jgi:hypothetical protein